MNANNARKAIVAAVIETFHGQNLHWGKRDCAHLAAFALERAGYTPDLGRFGKYHNARTALKRLAEYGFDGVEAWLDSIPGLDRAKTFGHALQGDILALPGEDSRLPSLGVYLGQRAALYFAAVDGHPCVKHALHQLPLAIWSAKPWAS